MKIDIEKTPNIDQIEIILIKYYLYKLRGSRPKTAKMIGRSRRHIDKMINKHPELLKWRSLLVCPFAEYLEGIPTAEEAINFVKSKAAYRFNTQAGKEMMLKQIHALYEGIAKGRLVA